MRANCSRELMAPVNEFKTVYHLGARDIKWYTAIKPKCTHRPIGNFQILC